MANEIFIIDSQHKCLPGHFPGNPIVPGALILSHAIAFAERITGRFTTSIIFAKFEHLLRPGEYCHLDFELSEEDKVRIRINTQHHAVLVLYLQFDTSVMQYD